MLQGFLFHFSLAKLTTLYRVVFFVAKKYLKKFKKTIDNLKNKCYNKGTK